MLSSSISYFALLTITKKGHFSKAGSAYASPIWATKRRTRCEPSQDSLRGVQHMPRHPSSCLSYINLSLCLLWAQSLLGLFQPTHDYLMSSFSSFRSLSETSNTSIECSADHPAFSIRFSMLFSKVEILSFSAAF